MTGSNNGRIRIFQINLNWKEKIKKINPDKINHPDQQWEYNTLLGCMDIRLLCVIRRTPDICIYHYTRRRYDIDGHPHGSIYQLPLQCDVDGHTNRVPILCTDISHSFSYLLPILGISRLFFMHIYIFILFLSMIYLWNTFIY